MAISQLTVGGESCGACAASYVLEELAGKHLNLVAIKKLWYSVQFAPTKPPNKSFHPAAPYVLNSHTDPTKLVLALRKEGLNAHAHMQPHSPLAGLMALLHDASVVKKQEGLRLLIGMSKWRAIGIYFTTGLHYVLTKHDGGHYQIMDSNGKIPAYIKPDKDSALPGLPPKNLAEISANVDGIKTNYKYQGACLIVWK